MLYKRHFYFFISLIFTSMSVYTQNHEVTPLILFLKKLSYLMWYAFFFFPQIFGALFLGNGLYVVQSFILLLCMIIIESYCIHRFIKTSYRLIIPRMILINFIDIIVQGAVAYPLLYFIDLHNYANSFYSKVYSLYGLTICASIIILISRITASYIIYKWFDNTTPKNLLKNTIIKANCISYIFIVVTAFFLSKLAIYLY